MKEIIKKVKVTHGEEYKGRVVKVCAKKNKSFETPTKAPTSTEINGKRNISFDGPFINPVFEIAQRYNKLDYVHNLHRKNGVYRRKISEINAYSDGLVDRYLVKFYPQLPYISNDEPLTDRDIRSLIDLQKESNVNIIIIPEPSNECSPEAFHNNLKKFWDYITEIRPDATVMPYLSLKQDHDLFEKKLNILKEYEHALHAIGIRFASMREYMPNLYSLAEFSKYDFWVHCSNGRKVSNWREASPGGQLHALQRYGVDTVSIEIPMGMGNSTKDYTTARYFNTENMTIPPIIESVDSNNNLRCDCPICGEQNLENIAEDLSRFTSEDRSLRTVLGDFSKVHEVFASTSEFDVSRQKIKEDALKEYLNGKAGLKEFAKDPK